MRPADEVNFTRPTEQTLRWRTARLGAHGLSYASAMWRLGSGNMFEMTSMTYHMPVVDDRSQKVIATPKVAQENQASDTKRHATATKGTMQ